MIRQNRKPHRISPGSTSTGLEAILWVPVNSSQLFFNDELTVCQKEPTLFLVHCQFVHEKLITESVKQSVSVVYTVFQKNQPLLLSSITIISTDFSENLNSIAEGMLNLRI